MKVWLGGRCRWLGRRSGVLAVRKAKAMRKMEKKGMGVENGFKGSGSAGKGSVQHDELPGHISLGMFLLWAVSKSWWAFSHN